MVEGANPKRDLANRASRCGCRSRSYGNQSRHRSLKGCPDADTYDNLCSLADPQPDSHVYAHAHTYADASASAHANPDANPDADADALAYTDADPRTDAHSDSYARLQRRTIPELGVAILR